MKINEVKVKICGVRTLEAAEVAVEAGVDFLGVNFVRVSLRCVMVDLAKEIIEAVRGRVKIVGVFRDEDVAEVNRISKEVGLDFVQLHGGEDQEYIKQMETRVIKVIYDVDEVERYFVDYFMLDRVKQGEGEMVDFGVAKVLAEKYAIFYGGGLTPENVGEVVERVRPFAVDVAGGIETGGVQDVEKIREFIRNAKGFEL